MLTKLHGRFSIVSTNKPATNISDMPTTSPLLPELTDDAQIAMDKPGIWEPRPPEDVERLRKGLKVTPVRLQVNSIPDIWARPLLFEMALFDEKHQLHARTLGEWRGLLALLALKNVKNLNKLIVQPLKISESENSAPNTEFMDAAHRLLPSTSISADTNWSDSYVFLYHDGFKPRPIGMTSPTTLVFTSSYYFNYISGVNWFDTEFLQDPVEQLSPIERPALASWLTNLHSRLKGKQTDTDCDTDLLNALLNHVESYRDSVAQGASAAQFVPASSGFGISPGHGIYHFIEFPARVSEPIGVSPVRLVPSEGRTGTPTIYIADKEIIEQWGEDPRNIYIGTGTLADLGPAGHPNGVHHTFNGIEVIDAEVWNATEFFADKLTAVRVPNAFPGAKEIKWEGEQPSNISYLLPLNERMLDYLSPDELLKRVSFEQLPTGDIRVRLRLTLGGDPRRDFVATRDYPVDKIDSSESVVIELFPNFVVSGWKSYFLSYYADDPTFSFQIRPRVSGQAEHFSPQREAARSQSIWKLNEYPEALICNFEGNAVGLLIPNRPEPPQPQTQRFTVGVDFGASGTSVYIRKDTSDPTPFVANPHKLVITNPTDTQKARAIDQFLPNEPVGIPFLSLFRQFRNEVGLNELKPLLEGHIHYYSADAESDLNKPDIFADLKWSSDPQNRLRVRALLTQLCLQATVEIASSGGSNIEWKFSFPTAFSEHDQHAFITNWQQIIKECQQLTGFDFKEPTHLTESIASGLYFRKKHSVSTVVGALFIDVGSSTSDVSVWQDDDLVWQASLCFAGRDIFLRYIRDHLETLELFRVPVEKIKNASGDEVKQWAETDALLQKYSEEIFNTLPLNADTPEVKRLRQHLAFGLSGLLYYVGLNIRRLIDLGLFRPPIPPVYFGGNGSRMVRWLSNGSVDVSPTAAKLFETMFRLGIGKNLDGTFQVAVSKHPKQEAACGLVIDLPANTGVSEYDKILVAGEEFVVAGDTKTASETIDRMTFKSGIQPTRNLSEFSIFVKAFNDFADDHRSFIDQVEWNRKKEEIMIGDIALQISDINTSEIVDFEPLFILALKSFLTR